MCESSPVLLETAAPHPLSWSPPNRRLDLEEPGHRQFRRPRRGPAKDQSRQTGSALVCRTDSGWELSLVNSHSLAMQRTFLSLDGSAMLIQPICTHPTRSFLSNDYLTARPGCIEKPESLRVKVRTYIYISLLTLSEPERLL